MSRRTVSQSCPRIVMPEQLGVCLIGLRKSLLQHSSNPGMKLLTADSQQAVVGGVLHKRVLKSVYRPRPCASAEGQSRANKLSRGLPQFLLGQAGYGGEHLM